MTTKFMTNLDTYFYDFLQKEAKQNAVSKREVLEKILATYIEWKEQEQMKADYETMSQDEEYLSEMQDNNSYL